MLREDVKLILLQIRSKYNGETKWDCMPKKSWPILYSKLHYKVGQDFFGYTVKRTVYPTNTLWGMISGFDRKKDMRYEGGTNWDGTMWNDPSVGQTVHCSTVYTTG